MNAHATRYNSLRRRVDKRLRSLVAGNTPKELNDACRYVLEAGGKRVRSTLVLLSCEAVGGAIRDAVDASAAVEVMHNFTLVHDDVMDHAPSRRGRATVHTKWNINTALLAGDVLIGLAYRCALKTKSQQLQRILTVLTEGMLDVCEGQALDLEFETRSDVTLADYFEMIEKKTARLISTSTELGGLIGNGTEKQIAALRQFGHYLGRAFQLQDDLLDVVADEKDFGKTIGGDIVEGKKTFLLMKSLEHSRGNNRLALMRVLHRKSGKRLMTNAERECEVKAVAAIYHSSGAIAAAQKMIRRDTQRANAALMSLPQSNAREMLFWLSEMLVKRNF